MFQVSRYQLFLLASVLAGCSSLLAEHGASAPGASNSATRPFPT